MHLNTPLIPALPPFALPGQHAWLKMDALQPAGSFKHRGVGRLCSAKVAAGATAIVCASGGNAGYAAAWAARALGVPAHIVVPESTGVPVREAIAALGAQVQVHGSVWDDAHAHAVQLAEKLGAAYVHPFDDPLLWNGHATLIDEVVAAGVSFDCVVLAVGGGGLLAGVIEGLRRNGLEHIPVIAAETVGAASLHESLKARERITLPAITSIAGTLGAKRVAQRAFELCFEHPVQSVTVTDGEAVDACLAFADTHRVLVEPACGAALAVPLVHRGLIEQFKAPLIEVCGGVGVSLDKLNEWKGTAAWKTMPR
jgi:L-serine/L-threonine ammonia-lyase